VVLDVNIVLSKYGFIGVAAFANTVYSWVYRN
jgi:hypothetical protein